MFHSLRQKLIAAYLLFAFLGFAVIALFSSAMMRKHTIILYAGQLYSEATSLAGRCSDAYQGTSLDLSEITPRLETAASCHGAEVWIIDRNGLISADSGHTRAGTAISAFNPADRGNRLYTISRFYGTFPGDVLTVAAPITGNMNTYGYVLIHLPMTVIEDQSYGYLNTVYITGLVLFGLSFLIMLVVSRAVIRPLREINYAAKQYAEGNLTYNIPIHSHDEIGYLAGTLNYMSGEINDMEEYQKNFIANISHDFRSPLTSIKGYLEAILDGTIPPELYQKYLSIIISETKRLTKLTESMLTLNSMDSGRNTLNRTNFDINRTIKETAASFEGTCGARGITFDLTFSGEIQMVWADYGKIQQVLYNLIDNAIKFSHDQSVIYITAQEKGEKIFISVKDTGIGIPRKSIPKIWERFYKTDLSRGKDKKGTGLGLAIVKEIIQAHGENIDCISTEGVGSEFIFSLPKAKEL